jgi:hypothetical protein
VWSTAFESAKQFAAKGYRVVPEHSVIPVPKPPSTKPAEPLPPGTESAFTDSTKPILQCTCNDPLCSASGKHPHTYKWPDNASSDLDQLYKWSAQFPGCNWSTLTKLDTGKGVTVVIDADYRNDHFGDIHDGDKNLAKLQAAIGESLPPNTPTVRTGGGGRNYWFRLPDGVTLPSSDAIFKNTKYGSFPNIDLKCVGGKVMLPGSKHKSGQQYEWISDTTIDGELPEMPPKLLALIQETIEAKKQAKAGINYKYDTAAIYGDGERNAALTSYLGWRRLSVLTLDELMMFANAFNQMQCQPPLPEAEVLSIAKSMMKYKAVLGKCFPLDDTGNAYLFADLHGDAVRFDHHREKWFLWDEHRWALDQGNRIRRLAEDVAIARRENLSAEPSKKEITFALRCLSESLNR